VVRIYPVIRLASVLPAYPGLRPCSCLPPSYCLAVHHRLTYANLGLALGGFWGLREGAARPLAVSNARLRLNSVLNSVTRRGTFIGNSAGVLGAIPLHALPPLLFG
jgi:hypothetical protein